MNLILVVMVMVAGVIQPGRMELIADSDNCLQEIQIVHAVNRANVTAGRDVQYLSQCETR